MKVKEFIKLNADIDVYDDVCEELGICFCGPMLMTEEGEKRFAEVLDYEIELDFSGSIKTAVIHIDGDDGNGWKKRLRKAEEFFYSAAGYCADEDFQKWFIMPDYGQYAIAQNANMDITIYCDTTPWFTDEEMSKDNLCDMSFPRQMVQEYYIANGGSLLGFTHWITDEYTADDTDGLFSFCKDRGFIAVREN